MRLTLCVAVWLVGCEGVLGAAAAGPRGTSRVMPEPPVASAVQPSSVRRLARHEYEHTVADLLGIEGYSAAAFPADGRVSGYSASTDLRVDAALGEALAVAAEALAEEAVRDHFASLVPCARGEPECPRAFVTRFAARAFRRPASAEEIADLLALFELAAAPPGTFDEGVALVVRAVLQSASFLYVPQIGEGAERVLDGYEIASALSYFLTASAPDEALLDAAASGALARADAREREARRLLRDHPRAPAQVTRFVREWLGLDTLSDVTREVSSGDFAALRPRFEHETARFVEEVVFRGDASFELLLAADFTVADDELAAFYGLPSGGPGWARRSLAGTPRRGLLAQAAFLAAHASSDETSPIKRGVTVLRRLLCTEISFPTGPLAERAMVRPPPAATTRERFAQHSRDPVCAACHARIDPIGFAFEEFDAIGAFRDEEGGAPIDSSGALIGTDVDGPFRDAADLAAMLAARERAQECFAQNLFRFASARASSALDASFVATWRAMPEARRSSLLEIWIELARCELFVRRREAP